MKKLKLILPILFLSLLFTSCYNDGPPSIEIQEQAELMSQDTVVTNYFEAMSTTFKISSENLGLFQLNKYYSLLKEENTNHCDIKKEVFDGNENLEKFAEASCELLKLSEAFIVEYPDFSNMKRADRRAIIRILTEPFTLNMMERK